MCSMCIHIYIYNIIVYVYIYIYIIYIYIYHIYIYTYIYIYIYIVYLRLYTTWLIRQYHVPEHRRLRAFHSAAALRLCGLRPCAWYDTILSQNMLKLFVSPETYRIDFAGMDKTSRVFPGTWRICRIYVDLPGGLVCFCLNISSQTERNRSPIAAEGRNRPGGLLTVPNVAFWRDKKRPGLVMTNI